LKGQKTNRPPRTVDLLPALATDLAEWRLASGRPDGEAYVFPAAGGGPWRDHDWRNWRKRVFIPAAEAARVETRGRTTCGTPSPHYSSTRDGTRSSTSPPSSGTTRR
jgi:hypothetical protein